MEAELLEPVVHGPVRARQEARADPVGPTPQPQIEAGRLDLIRRERRLGPDDACLGQARDRLVGLYAVLQRNHGIFRSNFNS